MSNLLNSARAYIGKASTAALKIAPLAILATPAILRAQIVLSGGYVDSGWGPGTFSNNFPNVDAAVYAYPVNSSGNTGFSLMDSVTLNMSASASGGLYQFYLANASGPGTVNDGDLFQVSYDVTIATTGDVVPGNWTIEGSYGWDQVVISGTGTGEFTGSGSAVMTEGTLGSPSYGELIFSEDSLTSTSGGTFTVTFNSLTLNEANASAVPEPTTYALVAGLGALGLAGLRLRRRALAEI